MKILDKYNHNNMDHRETNMASMSIHIRAEWNEGDFAWTSFDDEIMRRLKEIGFKFYPNITKDGLEAYIKLDKTVKLRVKSADLETKIKNQ